MKYLSTRGASPALGFSQALEQSLAPDGGLYVPEVFPRAPQLEPGAENHLARLAVKLLSPYLKNDRLQDDLTAICEAAFTFPIPLVKLSHETSLLELFHGPTAAFKDVGARFLAECVSRLPETPTRRRLILVATSGDTGGAVAAAFHEKPGIDVAILYPKGRISLRQEKQLTAWGGNVRAFSVRGSFDDCQKLVKAALNDQKLRRRRSLVSANSISIGRLLPQQVYYATAALAYKAQTGVAPGFVIPTGNLGNAVACLWAKRMGFPIAQVVLATNANRAIPDFLATSQWAPQKTIATLANAMDVGDPSNMERVIHLYPESRGRKEALRAFSVTDDEIRQTIAQGEKKWRQVFCPHTATAIFTREKLAGGNWIVVATAHPAKFEGIVEPLVGHPVPVPPALSAILERESAFTEIDPDVKELAKVVGD